MTRRLSFRVIEGGGDPVAKPQPSPPVYMVGVIVGTWFACVAVAWTAATVCGALGLNRP